MRTGLFLLAGLLLFGASMILGRLFGEQFPGARGWAVTFAAVIWLALTVLNLWVGVTRAGYSLREEAPIFLLLFGLPFVLALLARRWL